MILCNIFGAKETTNSELSYGAQFAALTFQVIIKVP